MTDRGPGVGRDRPPARPGFRVVAGPGSPDPTDLAAGRWATGLTVRTYGRRVGIRASREHLLESVTARLPPGWTRASDTEGVERLYSVLEVDSTPPAVQLWVDGAELCHASALEQTLAVFEADLQHWIAEMAEGRVFLHAGAVGWEGGAVLVPGQSGTGKTTMVAALVLAGATYYSDEYAVLDPRGRVHPFPRHLSVRLTESHRWRVAVEQIGGRAGTAPLPVRLVILTTYRAGGRWAPRRLSAGHAMLELLAHTIPARRAPTAALAAIRTLVRDTPVLESERPEAADLAGAILALCSRPRGSALRDHGRTPCPASAPRLDATTS